MRRPEEFTFPCRAKASKATAEPRNPYFLFLRVDRKIEIRTKSPPIIAP